MVVDLTLAATVASLGEAELWGGSRPAGVDIGPRPLVATALLIAAGFIVVRRRWPMRALLGAAAIALLPWLRWDAAEAAGAFLPLIVLLYTVAAHCERRAAIRGLAVFGVVAVVHELRDPLNADAANALGAVPLYLVAISAWTVGLYMRTRRAYVDDLEERADRVEREREERIRTATADERARIARELHDAVAHAMSVVVLQAGAAEELLVSDPTRAQRPLQRAQNAAREGLVEMRRLVGVLRSDAEDALSPQPGLETIASLVERVRNSGLDVDVSIEGEVRRLPVGLEISGYRIVQEALTNALRHSNASKARVRIAYGTALELDVEDNGYGAADTPEPGHGLVGIRERAALYGGRAYTGPGEEGGFRVHVTLPIAEGS